MREKEKKQMMFRNEWKHSVNRSDYMTIRNRLSVIAKDNIHAGLGGKYRVRSLRFEEPEEEKKKGLINAISKKESFRIRFYNENTEYIRLEKVIRINGKCGKLSARLTENECRKILSGQLDWMEDSEEPLIAEFYGRLAQNGCRPGSVVDCQREAFVYRSCNVRITMDSEIRSGIPAAELLNIRDTAGFVPEKEAVILEVKYDCFLPEIIRSAIRVKEPSQSSFSRYEARHVFG